MLCSAEILVVLPQAGAERKWLTWPAQALRLVWLVCSWKPTQTLQKHDAMAQAPYRSISWSHF